MAQEWLVSFLKVAGKSIKLTNNALLNTQNLMRAYSLIHQSIVKEHPSEFHMIISRVEFE